jgi:hypothetical protein
MIIVPLESSFGTQPSQAQQETIAELQMRAKAAGLLGTIVPVWDAGDGRLGSIAPVQWRPFFERINFQWVGMHQNAEIAWWIP